MTPRQVAGDIKYTQERKYKEEETMRSPWVKKRRANAPAGLKGSERARVVRKQLKL